jgi:hypothetical protein
MSLKENDIYFENVYAERCEWLEAEGKTENDVKTDDDGEEYVIVCMEEGEERHFEKVYLPKELCR